MNLLIGCSIAAAAAMLIGAGLWLINRGSRIE